MFKVLVLAAGVCKSNLQSCSLRMSSTLSLSVRSRVSAVSELHGRLHRHPGHPRLLQRKTLRERVSLSQSSVRRHSLPLALLLLRHSERRGYRGGYRAETDGYYYLRSGSYYTSYTWTRERPVLRVTLSIWTNRITSRYTTATEWELA